QQASWRGRARIGGRAAGRLARLQRRDRATGGPGWYRLIGEQRPPGVARRRGDSDPRADLVTARPRLRLERLSRVAKKRVDTAADEGVEEAPVEVETDA